MGHKEVIISLCDIYNPKRDMTVWKSDLQELNYSLSTRNQHHTAEAKTSPISMQRH